MPESFVLSARHGYFLFFFFVFFTHADVAIASYVGIWHPHSNPTYLALNGHPVNNWTNVIKCMQWFWHLLPTHWKQLKLMEHTCNACWEMSQLLTCMWLNKKKWTADKRYFNLINQLILTEKRNLRDLAEKHSLNNLMQGTILCMGKYKVNDILF